MSTSKSAISVTSTFGPIRIELYDQHATRLARGFGQLQHAVPPGVYSLQYGSGVDFREELIRVARGQTVERHIDHKISTAAPISTSVTSHEFHREAAENLSRNPTPVTPGGRAGLMVFARAVDGDGRGPVSMHGLRLLDSSLKEICNLESAELQHPNDGWAGTCLEVAPGGYALKWNDEPDSSSGGLLQSLWASKEWTTIVFLGYGVPPNEVRAEGDAPLGPRLYRQAASIHMAPFDGGFNAGPDVVHIKNQPLDWDSREARVGQALDLALLGLRNGSTVVPDDLLDLLLQSKFGNPMLGIVGAYALLQRRSPDWPRVNVVLDNLNRMLGPEHPDMSALSAMALNAGDLQPSVLPTSVAWPPMLSAGYRAILERDWRDPQELIQQGSQAVIAAPGLQPEFPWTCWATEYSGVGPVIESAGSVARTSGSNKELEQLYELFPSLIGGTLTLSKQVDLGGESLALYRQPLGTGAGSASPAEARVLAGTLGRMMRQVRMLKQLDPTLQIRDLKPAHFRQLGLPRSSVEQVLASLHATPGDATSANVMAADAPSRGTDYDFIVATSSADDSISFTLDTRRARTEVRAQMTQRKLLRELLARASTDTNDDPRLGRMLFQLLVPPEVEPFLGGTDRMVLELDDGTAPIPWELLDPEVAQEADSDRRPWAVRTQLLRKLRAREFRATAQDASVDDAVFVIGEPLIHDPAYPPLPGARAEAHAVFDALIGPGGIGPERVTGLLGDADASAVINGLLARRYRIVHAAGHGEPIQRDAVGNIVSRGGVVLSGGAFLGPAEINSMRTVPELVFVNCCHRAARGTSQTLRSIDRSAFAASVAAMLIEIGVRCVVAAGWAVDDGPAVTFATTFYRTLLAGAPFSTAVAAAREAAWREDGSSQTWAAYQCYGDPNWVFTGSIGDTQAARPMADLPTTPSARAGAGAGEPNGRRAPKKSGPTLAALNARIAALQAQADALRKKEVAEVVAKIKDAISYYGLTAADLGLATGVRKNAKLPAAGGDKPASKRRKKVTPKSSARVVKFKDDQGNTWSGMGKRPAWFKAALASGMTPEELLARH